MGCRSALFVALLLMPTIGSAQWTDPVLMDSNEDTIGINTGYKEWCPFLSADEQYFYFARERINNDLYVCHREGEGWSEPMKLSFCTAIGDERNPAVNATNDTLYFITFSGGWDIFWSFRTGPCDTCWGTPERLPEPINSTGIEFSVWCTPDNQRLLFSSWRISANGEDIYECRRDSSTLTGWSDPVLLPGYINTGNTGYIESYPSMGLDTTEIFFWGRLTRIYRSELTDIGWTRGDSLPDIFTQRRAVTPAISADGRRLYFAGRYGDPVPAADIYYSERPEAADSIPSGRSRHDQELRIWIYPNPIRDRAWLELTGGARRVMLFDILGRNISVVEFNPSLQNVTYLVDFERPAFPSGTYFLTAENGTEIRSVQVQLIK